MEYEHVDGKDKGKIVLYALSTCVWCRRTKKLLGELGVAYDFVFIDQKSSEEKELYKDEIRKHNPRCSYPTLVLNDERCIVGYQASEIRGALSG